MCLYFVDFTLKVESQSEEKLKFSYSLTSQGFKNNPAECASQLPNLKYPKTEEYSPADYISHKKKQLREAFSPSAWCSLRAWCRSGELVRVEEQTYKGIRAKYIEARITATDGTVYIKKDWVSMESLLQGNFEFDITRADGSAFLDFKTMVSAAY
jgi:hypothetical protein